MTRNCTDDLVSTGLVGAKLHGRCLPGIRVDGELHRRSVAVPAMTAALHHRRCKSADLQVMLGRIKVGEFESYCLAERDLNRLRHELCILSPDLDGRVAGRIGSATRHDQAGCSGQSYQQEIKPG